jgi:hypothetical protein
MWARAEWPVKRLGRLLQRVRNNLIWQVEEATQVLNAFIGEVPVVVLPREVLPDVFLLPEALHELDHLEVQHVNMRVLRQVLVLGIEHPSAIAHTRIKEKKFTKNVLASIYLELSIWF